MRRGRVATPPASPSQKMKRKFFLLLSPDPAPSGDPAPGTPPPDPTPSGDPPPPKGTPKIVAKTQLKTPNEIRLEKELAAVRDELDGLKGWKSEVDAALEGFDVKLKTGTVQPPAAGKSFLADLDEKLWGKS
jgi:hypothetical protein